MSKALQYTLASLILLFPINTYAQINLPDFQREGMEYINVGDSITYCYSNDSTYKMVWTVTGHYSRKFQILYKESILVIDGEFSKFGRHQMVWSGLWSAYYKNGKIKARGYYYEQQPIGPWEYYYDNGQLKERFVLSKICKTDKRDCEVCKTGLYEYYYSNGQVKEKGLYYARLDTNCIDTVYVTDPVTTKTQHVVTKGNKHYKSSKIGEWYYYRENGEIARIEKH